MRQYLYITHGVQIDLSVAIVDQYILVYTIAYCSLSRMDSQSMTEYVLVQIHIARSCRK